MALTYKYKARPDEAWDKRANQQGGSGVGIIKDDFKTYSPPKGDNYVRILPPTWEEAEHYGFDIWVHYGIGPDRSSIICINKMQNKRCPICEAQQKLNRAGDGEGAKEIAAGKRVAVWVINRKDEAAGPMVWTMPWTLDRDVVKVSKDRASGETYLIDHPWEGYNISFERTGDQITTKYVGIQIDRKPSSVPEVMLEYAVAFPIPETLVYLSYDEIKRIYEGGMSDDSAAAGDKPRERPSQDAEAETTQKWKPRGKAAAPAEDPGPDEAYKRGEPEPEPAEQEERQTNGNGAERPSQRRDDPPPEKETAPTGKSRADELRARFGNRS